MIFRKAIGWGVAQFYKINGSRSEIVSYIQRSNVRLPIVFHAATRNEVFRILSWLDKARILPSVELTFDDGWLEFLDVIAVLEEFNTSATLFIAPGEIYRGRVWTDGLSVPQRQALYSKSEDERIAEVEKLIKSRGRRLMNEAEVKDVARHPLVNIGNHTWSHLSCPHRPIEEVLSEIDRSQKVLTEWTGGVAPTDFAYPFGRGTTELDVAIRKRGMTPWYTRQGFITDETRGASRNMVYEGMSLDENLGRILMAWPKVGETL